MDNKELDVIVDAIRQRRSIREFTGEKIPDEHIELILDSARHAPSPENMQMWRYVVIREDEGLKKVIADMAQEMASLAFGSVPYESTAGRLWYLPDYSRPGVYERMRDGTLFRYPEKADTVIICCASETWHDSHVLYPNTLFGSVVVAMGIMQMWLVAQAMGYGCGYEALPFSDPRHVEYLCDKIGIPRSWLPLCAFCIGVPVSSRMLGPSRFPLEGIMYTERWGNPYTRLAFREEK
ncbi:MAG: nitroreductase family protein [Candidatus Hodarchaeales archaeon]